VRLFGPGLSALLRVLPDGDAIEDESAIADQGRF
jgi:hypothetical protein